MSSEKNVNLNEEAEQQIQAKNSSVEVFCDMAGTNVKESSEIISKIDGIKHENGDSDKANLVIEGKHLNNESQSNGKEENCTNPDLNTKGDDKKCDNCNTVDVENITNSLAEKVNLTNVPEVKETECDIDYTVVKEEKDKPLIPEKLINKVNRLAISGAANQSTSNNKSAVILKQESDSLKNLLTYESSSDDDGESEQNYQLGTTENSESESDSDDSESSDEDEDDDDEDENEEIE